MDRHLVLCFQVHQPCRLKKIPVGTIPTEFCLDEKLNQQIMERVSRECYVPTNKLLLKLIGQYPNIKVTFSISGTAMEQMENYAPDALESFKDLAATGSVDFLSEPYYHSLAFLMEGEEFEIQVLEHAEKIHEHFGVRPAVFKNTNLIYNDEIGRRISMMGFNGVLLEGNQGNTRKVCPHFLYEHRDLNGLKLLLRNQSLSDDIAFRFALSDWNLTPATFFSWLEAMPEDERLVVIALDYETFGEHHKPETGIFDFLEHLLLILGMQNTYQLATAADVLALYAPRQPVSIPDYTAVAGADLSDWVGNDMQREAFTQLTELESQIKKRNDPALLKQWRTLQGSDHFYYMSEKSGRSHFSPFANAQEAFHHFSLSLQCLAQAVTPGSGENADSEKLNEALEAERRNLIAPLWALTIDPNHGYDK